MAKKTKLTATTEHGTFTRTTAREYRFVNAYSRGIRATWHGSLEAAEKTGRNQYYRNIYLGTFPIDERS